MCSRAFHKTLFNGHTHTPNEHIYLSINRKGEETVACKFYSEKYHVIFESMMRKFSYLSYRNQKLDKIVRRLIHFLSMGNHRMLRFILKFYFLWCVFIETYNAIERRCWGSRWFGGSLKNEISYGCI